MTEQGTEPPEHTVARTLYEAYAAGRRGLVIVRCASPSVVDRARETIMRVRVPFGWRSLPMSELDPTDLLGFVVQRGGPRGPAFLAYGAPKASDGNLVPDFLELLARHTVGYAQRPTLLALLLTLDEIRQISTPARAFWDLKDAMIAWPSGPHTGQFLPARLDGSLNEAQRGSVAGMFGMGAAVGADVAAAMSGEGPWVGAAPADGSAAPDYYLTSPPLAGRRWGRVLLPLDPEGGQDIDAARVTLYKREVEQARHQLVKLAKRFRQAGEAKAAAECYVLLGMAGELRLDLAVAGQWYIHALQLYDEIGDDGGYVDCAAMLGYLYFLRGDQANATESFRRAMERAEAMADALRRAMSYRRMGIITEQGGGHEEAAALYERAAAIEEANHDERAFCRTLQHKARVLRLQGKREEAAVALERSLAVKERLDDVSGLASGWHELGNLHLESKRYSEALTAYQRALDHEKVVRDFAGMAYTSAQIGLVQKELFQFPSSARAFLIALALFRRLDSPHVPTIERALEAAVQMVDATELRDLRVSADAYVDQLLSAPA